MLINQDTGLKLSDFIKTSYIKQTFVAALLLFFGGSNFLYGVTEPTTLTYYLNIDDFAESFISIPTSNLTDPSLTIASSYLAGRAPIYNENNQKFGICSASFLNIQTADGVFTDIANYISADNGLIITWFTPTTLINLEADSVINGMVTECIVTATTKVGVNPFYGQTFNLIVSSSGGKIYFQFTRTGTIF